MKKEKFTITGMTCSACSARVEKAVKKVEGTQDVSVNLLTNSMQLQYDEAKTNPSAIIKAVVDAGYGAAVKGAPAAKTAGPQEDPVKKSIAEMKHRLTWSVVFLIPTLYISMHGLFFKLFGLPVPQIVSQIFDGPENAITFAFSQFLLVLPIMYLNRRYYIAGFRNLFQGAPNMDSLVGMGSMAAALFGAFAIFRMGWGFGHNDMALVMEYSTNLYFESAGMIVTLITVGKYLEARAKGQTSKALEKLMNLAPKQAMVVRGGVEQVVPVEQLVAGDEIVVRPGERIPADGIVLSGTTSIDESAITGEPIPVEKQQGDKVTSAAINKQGFIHFRAERVGADTTISQIIRLVDEASASKAPIARMADKIAGVFVPAVITIAVIAGGVWLAMGASVEFAFSIAICILVISCPCALGLATPVAIMVGTGKGAENGILIKSGEALEVAQSVDTVVMDKTGTITEGRPEVTDVTAVGISEQELLAVAAGLEQGSEHPLAEAVMNYAKKKGAAPKVMEDFSALFGRGVKAQADGHMYYAGNAKLMEENQIDLSAYESHLAALADDGCTPLIFAEDDHVIGILGAADVEKPTSKEAIERFKEMGIDVVMLTGDNARTAEAIRRRMGIPKVIAGVLPENKAEHIKKLQAEGHRVAMIGDGINDAPALAQADLGMAIGAGTDVAIESADAVLMKSDLLDAVSAIRLSKAVLRNIKENLFWALIYNVICIPLAAGILYPAFGIKLSPVIGAAAMSMSSVCVVMNALRLRFFKTDRSAAEAENSNVSAEKTAAAVSTDKKAAASAAAEPTKAKKEEIQMEKTLTIKGMMCAHCQKHVHDALAKMDGVTDVTVDLEGGKADVKATHDIAEADFRKVIEDAGYELVG
ncbi:heavy metal translocating P-type ATPase [uncultured Mitsuokella sp.]|uniref:heavy metal translocating P-type ATPase n=1 Tax=uncultured Mitsuokella sp. TaxID=453120 RepID=UPI00266FBB54|nr:heavy metal translocating P-type ATPase [uncultured Mitsuokella sp.]